MHQFCSLFLLINFATYFAGKIDGSPFVCMVSDWGFHIALICLQNIFKTIPHHLQTPWALVFGPV